jgi:hypothetical protein
MASKLAFVSALARFFPLFADFVRPHRLGHERRGDGGYAYETPSLVRVLDEFADDQRRKKSRRLNPMARGSERSMRLIVGLPEGLSTSARCAVI